jgi:hypothetical protein
MIEFNANTTRLSSDKDASTWRRKAVVLAVEFAACEGTLQTLEGPVAFQARDALMTGTQQERWPVPAAKFDRLYEPAMPGQDPRTNGTFKRRPALVYGKQIPVAFSVSTSDISNTTLFGNANDWLIQNESSELGVVANKIFLELYEK